MIINRFQNREEKRREEKRINISPNSNEFEINFEKLWKLYPRKERKKDVTKKSKEELYKAGFDIVKRALNNYLKKIESERIEKKFIMHGATFFNGRWSEYLEYEFESKKSDAVCYDFEDDVISV